MIIGTGIDIVELKRIENLIQRQKKFVDRILTDGEKETYSNLSERRKVEFLAGRFAAKEAYSKAVGTGIGGALSFLDIEIAANDFGKPIVKKPSDHHIHLSISHSRDYAIAQVIIESLSS
ncbi:holo-ACP synthase [Fredinandcohnia quinoae]|uniref:Holo-[acyl-carrier-protein] synthase n=1 Tax=Fredinandcohnia quinoae TaxID=2918902 RepID=A0AAW5E2X7_9BACI|nr:holo-ACP synthase [Fredinandcohnia sp. SECRCQ15]MCH1627256.1 holo-ACP synthase [Fredinandcohnia sp. SECRCQ15]